MQEIIPTFETQRLILKEITIEDAPAYQKYFADYEVIQHLSNRVPWPYPEDGAHQFIENFLIPNQGKGQWAWGIFLKTNPNELIGCIELFESNSTENRGFWLGKKFWGQGLMTEAVVPVMDYAFNKLGFTKMILANALGNTRSRRVKEKTLGRLIEVKPFKFVGSQYTESEFWEVTKEEWEAFKKS